GAVSASGSSRPGERCRERALPVRSRASPRHEHPAAAVAPSAPDAPRLRHPPAGGRRRPPHDPGAAGAQLAVDDPDLLARRRPTPAPRVRPVAPALLASRFTGETRFPPWAPSLVSRASRAVAAPAGRARLRQGQPLP